MSSSGSDTPFEVAKLCSNCEKMQFQDDVPQLYQSGPHLELDRELEDLPEGRRGPRTGVFFPTEFVLTDSYPELSKLRRSSQDGCEFCEFLHEIVRSFVSQDLHVNKMSGCTMSISISYSWAMLYENGYKNGRDFPNGLDAMLITAEFASNDIEHRTVTVRVVCHVESAYDSDPVSNWLRLRNRSNQEYCDADSVQWMKQTLETCIESHQHEVFDHEYLPERLIDVRPQIPRLILREEHTLLRFASTPKYTALSYCWGTGKGQARTTLATLSNRQAGITETDLPQVVQDAIQVTRALSIPFLWADALCILQDDSSDWARQCTEMHNIYGSAHVTLCAANSPACNEGFLRQTGQIIRISFRSRRVPGIEGSFLVQCKGLVASPGEIRAKPLFSDSVLSRWGSRGWVFQENVLSTRRLIFGARDMYFLCGKYSQRRGQVTSMRPWDRSIGKSDTEREPRALYRRWQGITHSYSSYKTISFTDATDILPALSGLAELLSGRLKDGYYAGHWGRFLHRSLLWFPSEEQIYGEPFQTASLSRPRSEAFIVPSWSQLSKGHTFGVFRDNRYDEEECYDSRSEIHLIEGKVILADTNPYGALKDCSLRLRGYTLNLSHQEVAVWRCSKSWGQRTFTLVVYGRCFGTLNFDCKPALHDHGGNCFSEGEFGRFRLLLLLWCDYLVDNVVPEATPTYSDSGAVSSSEHYSSESEPRSKEISDEREPGKIDCSDEAMSDQEPEVRGGFDSRQDIGQEQHISGGKASAENHDSSDEIQSQQDSLQGSPAKSSLQVRDIVRKGFGLIICATGNDGEFCRAGMFSPIFPRSLEEIDAQSPVGDLGGDIRELHSLAQVETVELV